MFLIKPNLNFVLYKLAKRVTTFSFLVHFN